MSARTKELLDFILSRRSIRKYTDDPVSEEIVEKLLEAGFAAPSARNKRPWHFIVVKDRKTLDRMADAHPYGKMLYEAPLAIIVCGEPQKDKNRKMDWVLDASAATQNILLAAHAAGLGAVWLGVWGRPDRDAAVREILNIPNNIGILSIVSIGVPAESKKPHSGIDTARVHYERW